MCLHSMQEVAQLLPCFEFNQCSSCLLCGFESKRAITERQPPGPLQAMNLFETEDFCGLRKTQYLRNVGR